MRQGQQHRRGRNRNNNNNRKGQNPLTRNFESSGPDVKIRGTPAHVAEKYMSLARDALSSGDPVLAENYLQHAEHYNRIILAYREQQSQPGEGQSANANGRGRSENASSGDEYSDDGEDSSNEDAPRVVQPGEPQPSLGKSPEGGKGEKSEGRRQRGGRNGQARESRERGEGRERGEARAPRERRRERQRFGESDQQPDFLRRPVRRRQSDDNAEGAEASDGKASPQPAEMGSEQQD